MKTFTEEFGNFLDKLQKNFVVKLFEEGYSQKETEKIFKIFIESVKNGNK